jgi:hypothetical protein
VSSVKQRWLVLCSVLLIIAVQVSLFFAMQKYQERKPDFASLYQAGRALLHERFPEFVSHHPLLNGEDYAVEYPNGMFPADTMHPPFEMVLYISLALLKFRIAYPLWWGCNLLLLFYADLLLWRHVANLQTQYPYLIILTATFFPVLVALVQGQNSILLLALLTASYDSLVNQRHFRAGFALSMGMFKFVLVIPILFWLILERRWKSIAGFAAGCVSLFLTSMWLVGINGIEDYVRMLAGFGKAAPEKPGTEMIMPNLRGLIQTAGAGFAPKIFLTILTLICSIALLIWVDSRNSKQSDLGLRFAIQVFLASLVSYHLYPHDVAILILPMALLFDYALREGVDRRFKTAVLIATGGVYLAPFVTPLQVSMPIIGLSSLVLLSWVRFGPRVKVMEQVVTP